MTNDSGQPRPAVGGHASLARMGTTLRRPDPPPLRVNPYAPVIVGTVLWAIAFVVLLTQHHDMAARGQGWWLWVALSGFLLGFWGMSLTWLHHRPPKVRRGPDERG